MLSCKIDECFDVFKAVAIQNTVVWFVTLYSLQMGTETSKEDSTPVFGVEMCKVRNRLVITSL
jgi:hypothetical protein